MNRSCQSRARRPLSKLSIGRSQDCRRTGTARNSSCATWQDRKPSRCVPECVENLVMLQNGIRLLHLAFHQDSAHPLLVSLIPCASSRISVGLGVSPQNYNPQWFALSLRFCSTLFLFWFSGSSVRLARCAVCRCALPFLSSCVLTCFFVSSEETLDLS